MEAVKAWGYNLESVPEGLKTKEMCREAFDASPDLGYEHCAILAYIPFPDVCLDMLKDSIGGPEMTDLASALRPEVIDKEIADFLVGQDGQPVIYSYPFADGRACHKSRVGIRQSDFEQQKCARGFENGKSLSCGDAGGLFPILSSYTIQQAHAGNLLGRKQIVRVSFSSKTGHATRPYHKRIQPVYFE